MNTTRTCESKDFINPYQRILKNRPAKKTILQIKQFKTVPSSSPLCTQRNIILATCVTVFCLTVGVLNQNQPLATPRRLTGTRNTPDGDYYIPREIITSDVNDDEKSMTDPSDKIQEEEAEEDLIDTTTDETWEETRHYYPMGCFKVFGAAKWGKHTTLKNGKATDEYQANKNRYFRLRVVVSDEQPKYKYELATFLRAEKDTTLRRGGFQRNTTKFSILKQNITFGEGCPKIVDPRRNERFVKERRVHWVKINNECYVRASGRWNSNNMDMKQAKALKKYFGNIKALMESVDGEKFDRQQHDWRLFKKYHSDDLREGNSLFCNEDHKFEIGDKNDRGIEINKGSDCPTCLKDGVKASTLCGWFTNTAKLSKRSDTYPFPMGLNWYCHPYNMLKDWTNGIVNKRITRKDNEYQKKLICDECGANKADGHEKLQWEICDETFNGECNGKFVR